MICLGINALVILIVSNVDDHEIFRLVPDMAFSIDLEYMGWGIVVWA